MDELQKAKAIRAKNDVRALILSKASVNGACGGENPLHVAILEGGLDAAEFLVNQKADLNFKDQALLMFFLLRHFSLNVVCWEKRKGRLLCSLLVNVGRTIAWSI